MFEIRTGLALHSREWSYKRLGSDRKMLKRRALLHRMSRLQTSSFLIVELMMCWRALYKTLFQNCEMMVRLDHEFGYQHHSCRSHRWSWLESWGKIFPQKKKKKKKNSTHGSSQHARQSLGFPLQSFFDSFLRNPSLPITGVGPSTDRPTSS